MSHVVMMAKAQAAEAMAHSGGQVQPVDAEGGMNGFTAVNGRTSPTSQSNKQLAAEQPRDESLLPPRDPIVRNDGESEQAHQFNHPNGGTSNHMNAYQSNGAHKRKRSTADMSEDESSGGSDRNSGSPPTVSPDVHMQDSSAYGHPNRPISEHAEGPWNGNTNDEQAEHLRMLAPIQHDNQQHPNETYGSATPMQNGHGMRPGYHKDEDTGLITTNAGVQMDPKKRKRAFTNRTKTGCQTCRRRKKKCDEGKPECNNCTRGGFKCEGYTPRVSWPPETKGKGAKQPIPLAQPLPHTPRELQDYSGNLHPRPPPRPHTQSHMELPPSYPPNMRPRPMTLEDESDRAVNNGWPYPPYTPSYREKDHGHGMPMQPMREPMRDSHDRPMSSLSGSSLHTMHSAHHMPHPVAAGVIGQAQQALHLTSQRATPMQSPMGYPPERSMVVSGERLKMQSGDYYAHCSPEFEADLMACTDNLNTFNSQRYDTRKQHLNSLDKVLVPEGRGPPPTTPGRNPIRHGKDFVVVPPFTCEFGYNIVIEDYVNIDAGCHISDPREVIIGKGTNIGPGVKIMGKVLPYQSELRYFAAKGGQAKAFEIHIGERVFIGANTVIQPDEMECVDGILRIGDRAYIKPGSVVNKSVPNDVIYGPKYTCDVISGLPPLPAQDEKSARSLR